MTQLTVKDIKEKLRHINDENDFIKQLRHDDRKGVQLALKTWDKRQAEKKALEDAYHDKNQFENELHKQGYELIAGIDEVGRGPLAGPVVCAAVILDSSKVILGLDDSKKLSLVKRTELYERILEKAKSVGIAYASPEEIDLANIYQATRLAMKRAVDQLSLRPDYLLVDDMTLDVDIDQLSLVKGDARSNSIAAASIIAKVERDQLMKDYSKQYPGYGFENNVGYGTAEHLQGLEQLGPSPIHRKSFQPIKGMLDSKSD